MEFALCAIDCAFPVEITLDDDNGRYTIRKSDTSGEYFNTAAELISWVKENFTAEQFCYEDEYFTMMDEISRYR